MSQYEYSEYVDSVVYDDNPLGLDLVEPHHMVELALALLDQAGVEMMTQVEICDAIHKSTPCSTTKRKVTQWRKVQKGAHEIIARILRP